MEANVQDVVHHTHRRGRYITSDVSTGNYRTLVYFGNENQHSLPLSLSLKRKRMKKKRSSGVNVHYETRMTTFISSEAL